MAKSGNSSKGLGELGPTIITIGGVAVVLYIAYKMFAQSSEHHKDEEKEEKYAKYFNPRTDGLHAQYKYAHTPDPHKHRHYGPEGDDTDHHSSPFADAHVKANLGKFMGT